MGVRAIYIFIYFLNLVDINNKEECFARYNYYFVIVN